MAGCGPADRPTFDVTSRSDGLEIGLVGIAGAQLVLVGGPVWTGGDPLLEEQPERLVAGPASTELLSRAVAADKPLRVSLPRQRLAGLPNPCALQLLAVAPDGTLVGASEIVVVERGGELALRDHFQSVSSTAAAVLFLYLVLPLVVVAVLARLRWPTGLPSLVGIGALGVALAACLVGRSLGETPLRQRVERGLAAPPLIWPGDWQLEGEASERILGPGFEQMIAAIAAARRDDEPVGVWCKPRGMSLLRAAHLAHRVGGTVRRHHKAASPEGLSVFCDVRAVGTLLAETEVGKLTRVGEDP